MRLAPPTSVFLAVLAIAVEGCNECAGTPSCHNYPQIGATALFVEHKSGTPVAGVSVAFIRRKGIDLDTDTVRAVSDDDGFLTLRVGSVYDGSAYGELAVTPPPPYVPFTIPDIALATSRVRGDGSFIGRFVVNPYFLMVGHVRDGKTLHPLAAARVIMRRIGGGRLTQDSMRFTTDFGGQFAWVDPEVLDPAPIVATFDIRATGYARTTLTRKIPLTYTATGFYFVILPIGTSSDTAAVTLPGRQP
jgi:hypothetical protein